MCYVVLWYERLKYIQWFIAFLTLPFHKMSKPPALSFSYNCIFPLKTNRLLQFFILRWPIWPSTHFVPPSEKKLNARPSHSHKIYKYTRFGDHDKLRLFETTCLEIHCSIVLRATLRYVRSRNVFKFFCNESLTPRLPCALQLLLNPLSLS